MWSASSGAYNKETGTGTVRYSGSVHFTGHSGQLDMTISNVSISITSATSATLYADVNSKLLDGTTYQRSGVALASLRLPQASTSGQTLSWNGASATLTSAGAGAFAGFYSAGDSLDPVSFSLTLGAQTQCSGASGTLPATGMDTDTAGPIGLAVLLLMLAGGALVITARRAGRVRQEVQVD